MSAFGYQALDQKGRTRKGVIEGDSAWHVRQALRNKGLMPLEVTEIESESSRDQGWKVFGKPRISINATELALITRQIATLLKSGLPLEEVLLIVSQQNDKTKLKSLLLAVRSKVLEGYTLAAGLSDFPSVFPGIYRSTVEAGESSGHLDLVMDRLADYTESRQVLRQKIMVALFYPIILTLIAVAVVTGLLAYVVPQVVHVFDSINQELPLLTRVIISISEFLQGYWIQIILFWAAVIGGGFYLLKLDGPNYWVHKYLLRVPLVSKLIRGLDTARFTRTLSILSNSGVPILESLAISKDVMSNRLMQTAVQDAADRVKEGSGLSEVLASSKLFPPVTIHLIASGESGGNLDEMLERASENQEREMESLITMIMGLFEPLLIIVMGVAVLIIVLAILMPIFELNQLVA